MMGIPNWLLEGTSGTLSTVFFFVAVGAVIYLMKLWNEPENVARRYHRELTFWQFYFDSKPAIALMFAFAGVALRVGDIWMRRHFTNHGLGEVPWNDYAIAVHLSASALAIVGAICWLRVSLPCGGYVWGAILVAALIVGFAPAILP